MSCYAALLYSILAAGKRVHGRPADTEPQQNRLITAHSALATHLAHQTRQLHNLTFPLLSDPEKETLAAWGAFGEKKLYGKVVQGVIRSTFLVDEAGKIEVAQYNVRATGHVAKLRRDLSV